MSHRLSNSLILLLMLSFLVAANTPQITSFDASQPPSTPTILPTMTGPMPVVPTTGASSITGAWLLELLKILTAWPVILGIVLWALHTPLIQFLGDMGQRATKFSIAQFSVELPESRGPSEPDVWTGSQLTEALQLAAVSDSRLETLTEQFKIDTPFDHLIVDIELGQKWLTSRLFLFTTMLQRMNRLRCVVFLYTDGNKPRTFLGIAHAEQLRWVLAQKYPWLEAAYADAYAAISPKPVDTSWKPAFVETFILNNAGAINQSNAAAIAHRFLRTIQVAGAPHPVSSPPGEPRTPTISPPNAPPSIKGVESEWEILDLNPPIWERATWLTVSRLRSDLLPEVLLTQAYVKDSPDLSSTKRQKAIVNRPGRFVALVDEEKIFQRLINRQALLENIGKRLSEPDD